MNLCRWLFRLAPAVLAIAVAAPVLAEFDEDYDAKPWQEVAVELPPAPVASNLLPFYVSPATENRFYIDGASLLAGSDGVIRYTMVVEAAGGARNVTYEGLRCTTRELRVYAFGQRDGSWSKSRGNDWRPVREAAANRQHAVLMNEYFCPPEVGGRMTPERMREALRRGGYSETQRGYR
jgi:CNP1-like family